MRLKRTTVVLLGLAGILAALGVPAAARADCPELVNFYRVVSQPPFDVWESHEQNVIEETATFPAGGSPTFFAIDDDEFYFYRLTSPSPFTQRWQLYENDVLVNDFLVYNKQLTLARVECGNFYFYRTYTQGISTYWELYRAPGEGGFQPPQLLSRFSFLTSQQPTFFGIDDEDIWFYRNFASGPFQIWRLYQNNQLVQSFSLYNKVLTLATIDDGNLLLYKHTTQGPFDYWTLYENDQLVQSFSFFNNPVTLLGVDNDHFYFYTKTVQGPFRTWQIYCNNFLACNFTTYNVDLTLAFADECDFDDHNGDTTPVYAAPTQTAVAK